MTAPLDLEAEILSAPFGRCAAVPQVSGLGRQAA
jgi:hypothetical protein